MIKFIRYGILVTATLFFALPVVLISLLWVESGRSIPVAQRQLSQSYSEDSRRLNILERTVAGAEFAQNWNRARFPCRSVSTLFTNLLGIGDEVTTLSISEAFTIQFRPPSEFSYETRYRLTNVLIACRLERTYTDATLLRAWLKKVYFGRGIYGSSNSAQSYFGKPPEKLDLVEAAALAALIKMPQLQEDELRWRRVTNTILEEVGKSSDTIGPQ